MSKITPFKTVDSSKKLPEVENAILKFWEDNKIFEKSVENRKTADNKNVYNFYDGPPFATGLPHYGHIVGTFIKDIIPRYWTMKGKYIPRKWGWDCHGLPIENIVEKELGSKTKKEIEELGVDKFNELCRSKVLEYADEWEKIIPRLGRWADMKDAYRTMDKEFMESVWWVFKQLWEKDLIYYNYRSMHICPRCETTLSQSEVSEGYKDVKDLSVIAKFEVTTNLQINYKSTNKSPSQSALSQQESVAKTYVLAWTTTPWTLPGNVALAVGKDIDYVKIALSSRKVDFSGEERADEKSLVRDPEQKKEYFILAKDLAGKVFEKSEYKIIEEFKGADLIGLKYKPLWDTYANDEKLENSENGWQVYDADFVTTDEGTGVVHIAPAFGEDDMSLGKEKNLPFVQHVAMNGTVDEKVEAIGGLNVKPIDNPQSTDVEVIKYLAGKELLFHKEKYEHSYPHCWRCDTPLINYATGSWFVAVTKIKNQLLKDAKDINWTPKHIKEGRFGNWLEGTRDWSISRQRFWASVMPIWVCDKCEEKKVFGSVAELKDASGVEVDDLHKHIVDKVTFKCEKCEGMMKRVPDVLDTWFDSGSMPYGQAHYPFDNKENFDQGFPADFIAEGIDQTRAWFYYLHVIAGGIFESKAFKNVIVNGIVLAEDGQKMSKKLQNYPDPMEMVNKYGADPLRLYLAQSPVVNANDLNFSEKDLSEIARGTFRMLWQSYSFFVMYANIDNWEVKYIGIPQVNNILDKWLISELQTLIKEVNNRMEKYELMQTTRLFAPFVDNLSNWYIRRSRKRFWKSENDNDKNEAYATLHYILVELAKTIAPFAPFIAEEIYRNLVIGSQSTVHNNEQSDRTSKAIERGDSRSNAFNEAPADLSVHLVDYPIADESLIDEKLNKKMKEVREIITAGLQLRAKNQIKVRQPLSELRIVNSELSEEFVEIIKEEVNVKNVASVQAVRDVENIVINEEKTVGLNVEITKELKLEGQARELIRAIQQMRKEVDYQLDDRIKIWYSGMSKVFEKFGNLIAKETLTNNIEPLQKKPNQKFDLEKDFEIDGEKLKIAIKK
ncbi:MAG TPA: isoleucine--tRNA ligase [Candidatus Moranbacteria bacterium]|nr:isoleucine--tRNA ligase [Candidatus Moranbacteria bacterium]